MIAIEKNIRKVTWNSKILKNKSKDRDSKFSGNVFFQQGLKSYWKKRRDGSLMLATIRDDTWNVLNMLHISQIKKDGIIQTSRVAAIID